jgi:hypothetical protein
MVRRALSHRRGSPLNLEVNTADPGYVTIPVLSVRTGGGSVTSARLPLSRHHQLRRSSSVSTNTSASTNFGGKMYDGGDGDGRVGYAGSVVVDDHDGDGEGLEGNGRIEEEGEGEGDSGVNGGR